MGYFKDVQTCAEHGFALSPEGDCVRCRTEVHTEGQRRQLVKVLSGGAFALVAIAGLGAAWGRLRTAVPAPAATATAPGPFAREMEVAASAPEPAAPAPSTKWDIAVAQHEVAAVEPATRAPAPVPVAAPVEITTTTYVVSRQGPRVTPPPPDPTDAWWTEGSRTRVVRSRGVYYGAGAAGIGNAGAGPNGMQNPASWGLPPNRGGNFSSRPAH